VFDGLIGSTDNFHRNSLAAYSFEFFLKTHIAFTAKNCKIVDEFYQTVICAGGRDNGKPGIREIYHQQLKMVKQIARLIINSWVRGKGAVYAFSVLYFEKTQSDKEL
jgi:hypothetical protein